MVRRGSDISPARTRRAGAHMRSAQFARLYADSRTGRVRAGAARIRETDVVATAALSGRGAAEGSGTHTILANSIVIELRTAHGALDCGPTATGAATAAGAASLTQVVGER